MDVRTRKKRFHLIEKTLMDIDCEHDQILLGLIKEIPDLSDQFKPFLQTANWSIDKRHSLINNLVQQLLQNDSLSSKFYQELQRLFPRYFLAFIQRLHTAVNCSTKITNQISIKQRFLVLLSQILQDYPILHTYFQNKFKKKKQNSVCFCLE